MKVGRDGLRFLSYQIHLDRIKDGVLLHACEIVKFLTELPVSGESMPLPPPYPPPLTHHWTEYSIFRISSYYKNNNVKLYKKNLDFIELVFPLSCLVVVPTLLIAFLHSNLLPTILVLTRLGIAGVPQNVFSSISLN